MRARRWLAGLRPRRLLVVAGRWAGRLPGRVPGGGTGRRAGLAALLTVTCSGAVGLLYDHADPLAATAWPAPTTVTVPVPTPTRAPVSAGVGPVGVAVGWYAARLGVPVGRVRALQQDRVGSARVRVLVLAQRPGGRLVTALVVVGRVGSGWRVVG